ncbi:hypothetical protein ANCCAN_28113 [Ancylostoma caninum]|uniref:Uncharacterized protein n=1 Tax=Ancylostoma caninum TaxID=29170 RepID=A0A368F3H0_ANCCA|nr:hypothetical protein ANCCAN_28113 [Ancylostoma caninum]
MESDEDITYAQVMRSGAYLASLQVPNFRCEKSDRERNIVLGAAKNAFALLNALLSETDRR